MLLYCFQDSSERLRPLQAKIDRLKEEKDDVIHKKDDKIEAAKAEVLVLKNLLNFNLVGPHPLGGLESLCYSWTDKKGIL